jgi:carbonic anhydrase/acetyltransferase-like protein (isoleucine patch superfamily)
MPAYSLQGRRPRYEDESSIWLAPDATIIGDVRLGRNVGIWFGVVIRGDNEPIAIGDDSNVQEHTVMHTDVGYPLVVGKGCTIGHRAILHGCTIGDNSLVGMGAIILNGAQIGRNSLVGAGALVTEGREFPDNSLIVGSPAKVVRPLDEKAVEMLKWSAAHYVENARRFKTGLAPAWSMAEPARGHGPAPEPGR